MNDKFENLAKRMTQSITRRAALKKFGVGLAGMALAFAGFIFTGASLKADYRPQVNIAPIHANAGVTAVLTSTSDPAVSIAIATGVVQTSLLGTCVEHAQLQVQFPATPDQPVVLNGTGSFTTIDGTKSLQFTVSGNATPDPANPNFFNAKYQVTFAGGTGPFASASGVGEITEVVMFTSASTGTVTWTLNGLVTTPR
jgi:hypothetical protein